MSPFSQRSANISVHSVLVQVLLCLVFNLNGTNAKIPGGFTDIHRLHIVQNGGVIYLGSYGFNEHGVCTVHIKQNGPVPNFDTNTDRNVGFFLEKVQNVNEARMERWLSQQSICPDVLYSQRGRKLTLVGLNETDHYAASADISTPGFYALYFFNCETNAVNLSATVIRYNQVRDRVSGKLVTRYLQVGDGPKPVVYALFLVAQIAMLISWSYLLIRANRENRYRIHFVMSMLLFLYNMCLVIDLYKYIQFDRTGKTSEVIHGFYGMFLILRGCIWVCVLVLLGTGWSILKPYLGDREKKGIVVILVLQLIANIAQVVMEELSEGDRSWIQWRDTLRIFDLLCCCGVLVPLVWSIRQLKESTQRDGKVLANIIRLQQFRSLYITFVVYIYYSRIVVMVINDALDFRSIWISTLLQELGTTVFFMYVGWRFQPGRHNPYLSLDLNILQAADMHNDLGMGNVKEFSNEPHESSFQEVVCVPSSLATQQDAKKTQSE